MVYIKLPQWTSFSSKHSSQRESIAISYIEIINMVKNKIAVIKNTFFSSTNWSIIWANTKYIKDTNIDIGTI